MKNKEHSIQPLVTEIDRGNPLRRMSTGASHPCVEAAQGLLNTHDPVTSDGVLGHDM